MKTHAPYHISHLYLDKQLLTPPELDTQNQGNYLVFWWDQIALGHLFLKPGSKLTPEEYWEKLTHAIRPAVDQYAQRSGAKADWQQWIQTQEVEAWAGWMSQIITGSIPQEIPDNVDVSVIICTRNRASQLQRCLVMLQELECVPAEIIVIDNAPTDDSTYEVVRKFEGVKYVKEPLPGLDIARNTGVLEAKCPIVTFVDDDVTVHPLCIYRIWETFLNPSIDAMTGLVIAFELKTEAQLLFETQWSFNRGYSDILYDQKYFQATVKKGPPVWEIGAGANMAFRRNVFEKVGLFDERLDVGAAGCSGDSEMWYRILANGLSIHYNPRAIVYHEHRKGTKDLQKQIFYYMRGHAAAALIQRTQKHGEGYKQYLLSQLPRYYGYMLLRGFPLYRSRFSTLAFETKGLLSGVLFYFRNRKRPALTQGGRRL